MRPPEPPRKRTTLASVASAAGVSLATVSKVLNGREDVAPETRAQVQRLLRERDYVPGPRRRNAAAHRTIGLLVENFRSPYTSELIQGVTDAADEFNVDVVVGRFSRRSGRDDGGSWARRLSGAGRDGVLIVTSDLTANHIARFERARIPLVVIDPVHLPEKGVTSIGATNWSGALSATQHLIELGHRRIAHITGPPGAAVTQARMHGFRAAMDNAGLAVDPNLVVDGGFGFEVGLDIATRLLAAENPPTAIFAATDITAMGAIQAAYRAGLAVPGELSVVGFDDTHMAAWASPPLTTVHTPLEEMSRVALRTLLRLMDGESVDSHHVELATALVVRSSTGRPRQVSER